MRRYSPRRYSGVSAGAYPWIPLDSYGFDIGYSLIHDGNIEVSGSKVVSGNIEGTCDDVFTLSSCKAFFLVTANHVSGAIDGVISRPLTGIRIRYNTVTVSGAVSGNLTASFNVAQRDGELA